MAISKEHSSNDDVDYELQRLGQLCLPKWYDRIQSVIVRPERPEFALKGEQANPHWLRALDQLRNAINTYDRRDQQPEASRLSSFISAILGNNAAAKTKTIQRREERDRPTSPMDAFFQDLEAFDFPTT
ncbi:hypothetical protein QBC34DRAFT_118132 [Podospora aff. communis PSN243]|uniref:Uncharacterized protein n=1 Tax=Podospora aff. communis PSN243 TaxID=3040156 RepID=A0AAV9GHT5_9PEZI|nr:hypothetical protein QBC34DRAFT_118132 [Podospora aff. communis PSN243]